MPVALHDFSGCSTYHLDILLTPAKVNILFVILFMAIFHFLGQSFQDLLDWGGGLFCVSVQFSKNLMHVA